MKLIQIKTQYRIIAKIRTNIDNLAFPWNWFKIETQDQIIAKIQRNMFHTDDYIGSNLATKNNACYIIIVDNGTHWCALELACPWYLFIVSFTITFILLRNQRYLSIVIVMVEKIVSFNQSLRYCHSLQMIPFKRKISPALQILLVIYVTIIITTK